MWSSSLLYHKEEENLNLRKRDKEKEEGKETPFSLLSSLLSSFFSIKYGLKLSCYHKSLQNII
jgi:hypothetical protein